MTTAEQACLATTARCSPATMPPGPKQQAQLAMNNTIRTDVLVDRAAEDLYPTWEKNREQWNLTGGDHPYHYLGSAIWFTRIGHAMAEAMTELLPAQ